MEERLQKILAQAGVASRRAAERMILDGRIRVNSEVVTELGTKADIEQDVIEVDGVVIGSAEEKVYFAFYKPVGFLTTMKDPQGRPTVAQFLKDLGSRVYPVGRLDGDAEGLLLLTNDGDLAARLMHPRHHVSKTYRVKVRGVPSEDALRRLSAGTIMLGDRPAAPTEVYPIKTGPDRAWLKLVLHEGRHHQVKRMCSQIGHPVLKLKRTAFGPVELGRLKPGEVRPLKKDEVKALMAAAGFSKTGRRRLVQD